MLKLKKINGESHMNTKLVAEYIRSQINSSETGNISIADTAEKFGYTKYEFSRKFKENFGFSAREFVSVLKLEKSIEKLIEGNSSVIWAQFESGYESTGSFSNTFKKNTGLSPKKYKKSIEKLYKATVHYKNDSALLNEAYYRLAEKNCLNKCAVNLVYPEKYESDITFVGIFYKPVPNHAPVVGRAVIPARTGNKCILENIPDGSYYILACSVEKKGSILRYFDLKSCLRGKVEDKITFPLDSDAENEFTIFLREAIPEDPPILINLPNLISGLIKKQ